MDQLINATTIMGLGVLFAGVMLLNWCTRVEGREQRERADPATKWSFIDGGKEHIQRKRSIRSALLALTGAGLALWGFVILVVYFSSLK